MGPLAQLARAARIYARTAWWGILSPRLHETRPLVVVQAVVLDERAPGRRILLSVRSDLQGWELPGGTPEPGEPLERALVREVHEETGLAVAVERHVGDWVRTGFRPHTACVYVARVRSGELRPSRETPVVRWFAVDVLPDTLFPWYREPIALALGEARAPVERAERQGVGAVLAGLRIDVTMRWRALRGNG